MSYRRTAAYSPPCLPWETAGWSCTGKYAYAPVAGERYSPPRAETEQNLLVGLGRLFALVISGGGRHGGGVMGCGLRGAALVQ